MYALINVIKAADSIDPDAVKAQWEKMSTIETVFGKGMNGGDETYGIKHHVLAVPSSYQKAMNGEVAFRGWIEPGPFHKGIALSGAVCEGGQLRPQTVTHPVS